MEAEIDTYRGDWNDAKTVLSQTPPRDARFVNLDLRRRALLGYCLSASGRALLDGAYQEAVQGGHRELLAQMEILEGKIRRGTDSERAWYLRAKQHATDQNDFYNEAVALNDLGTISLHKARYEEAAGLFEQASADEKQVGASVLASAASTNLAICYTQLGNPDRALALGKQALAIPGEADWVRGSILGAIGRAYAARGDTLEAIKHYQQALDISRKLDQPDNIRTWDNNLADALCSQGDWEAAAQANREEMSHTRTDENKAYAYLNSACIAAGRGHYADAIKFYGQARAFKTNDPAIQWEAYGGMARASVLAGSKRTARIYFEKAITAINQTEPGVSSFDNKLTFLSHLEGVYQDYVAFLAQNHDWDKALEVVESSRARILSETTAQRAGSQSFNIAELRPAAKRSGTVFLSYWLPRTPPAKAYVWVISPSGVRHFCLGGTRDIEPLVETVNKSLDSWESAAQAGKEGYRLYDAVLGPVAALIPPHAHVVIVPDGALDYLNFETLPVRSPEPHYWIEDATVAIAPSLAIAAAAPPKPKRYESLLIMGDVLYASEDFPPLTNSEEIEKVTSHFPPAGTSILRGGDAVPAAYRQANPQRFSVIHFSAHGEANAQSPLDSAIILSPKDGAFKLYARDVIGLPIKADLVTISACQSAGNRVYGGEGLVGFAWAFLKAGAHYVVAGLWNITEKPTPAMMDEFYGGVQAGKSPPDALREAKLTMLRSPAALHKPYYWGPFQVYIRY